MEVKMEVPLEIGTVMLKTARALEALTLVSERNYHLG